MSNVNRVVTGTKSEKSQIAKANLLKFVEKINVELEKYFLKELTQPFGLSKSEKSHTKQILKHIKEHNLRPAKRLRGSLVYYSYLLFKNNDTQKILKPAMCVELVHTALLIHDDFMDQDSTRRGKPTTHKLFESLHSQNNFVGDASHYGDVMAVNTGDVALCLGFELLGTSEFENNRKLKALNRLLRGIAHTSYGQAYDATLENLGKATEASIINLHLGKTAIYTYENPLHIGAILGGASSQDLDLLTSYAHPAGVAFQLQDDVLGLFGNPEKTGKPAHSDLRQGKMTLLIIKALEKANQKQKKSLRKLWGKSELTNKDADIAREIVIQTGSLEYSKKVSKKWARKAQKTVLEMRKRNWNNEAIDYLDGIAQYMIERDI